MLSVALVVALVVLLAGEARPWLATSWLPSRHPPVAPLVPFPPQHPPRASPTPFTPSHPPGTPGILSSLPALLDPFGLFSSSGEARVWVPGDAGESKGSSATATAASTASPQSIVYFPEGHNGQCQDFAPAGFNTYSFLSFMFAVANLVGLVANNVNNNLNNNNNNDNNNNNNQDNINVADSNSNINNDNSVDIPAAMVGRRRRRRRRRQTEWTRVVEEIEAEVSLAVLDFVRGVRTAAVVPDAACALRNLCEANRAAAGRGEAGKVAAEVLSLALVEWYPRQPPPAGAAELLSAAGEGRRGEECSAAHPACPDTTWRHHSTFLDLVTDPTHAAHLTETLTLIGDGFHGLPDLASLTPPPLPAPPASPATPPQRNTTHNTTRLC